jgi:hypothetical protein
MPANIRITQNRTCLGMPASGGRPHRWGVSCIIMLHVATITAGIVTLCAFVRLRHAGAVHAGAGAPCEILVGERSWS